jgi:hypothetical protein
MPEPWRTRNKVRVGLWKIVIEVCKAKLRLSHRCQPLTQHCVRRGVWLGKAEAKPVKQPKLYGETIFLQGSHQSSTTKLNLESSSAFQANDL